jgi:hypothetical protein
VRQAWAVAQGPVWQAAVADSGLREIERQQIWFVGQSDDSLHVTVAVPVGQVLELAMQSPPPSVWRQH